MMVESGPNMWQLRATGRGRGCSSDRRRRRRRRRGQCGVRLHYAADRVVSPGAVRASLDEWRAAGWLVGECAPPPRCNATHVLVRRHWLAPAGRCVPVGQLLCACACQSPPASPFPDCDCDRGPSLQPAPFGGYECAHTCHGTCSPQIGRPRGSCAFPPLAVHPLAVERADEVSRRSPILGRMYHHLRDSEGCVLKTDAPRANPDPQRLNPYISRRDVDAPQASAAELRAERSEYPFLSE